MTIEERVSVEHLHRLWNSCLSLSIYKKNKNSGPSCADCEHHLGVQIVLFGFKRKATMADQWREETPIERIVGPKSAVSETERRCGQTTLKGSAGQRSAYIDRSCRLADSGQRIFESSGPRIIDAEADAVPAPGSYTRP